MSQANVAAHIPPLAAVFDSAKTVVSPTYRFAADMRDSGRPVAIDGSQELIDNGDHHAAIFWMVAVHCRCQDVLVQAGLADAQKPYCAGLVQLLDDLGVSTFAEMQQRAAMIKKLLPQVWLVAEEIMAASPAIEA